MKLALRSFLTTLVCLFLSSCGGGGASDKPTTPITPTYFSVTTQVTAGGSISPASLSLQSSQNGEFTVTPEQGYSILTILGCEGALSNNIYTTSKITTDCQIEVDFLFNGINVSFEGVSGGEVSLNQSEWVLVNESDLVNIPSTEPLDNQIIYYKVDNKIFALNACDDLTCTISPYNLIVSTVSDAFSTDKKQQAINLVNNVLSIDDSSFNKVSSESHVDNETYENWVSTTNLLNVINTISGDIIDGSVDLPEVKISFPKAKIRQEEVISIEITEAPYLDDDTQLIVKSFSQNTVSPNSATTQAYLSDYALQIETTDRVNGEKVNSIVYFGFNVGEWKGKLSPITHTLTMLYIQQPEWLFLPEAEKILIGTRLTSLGIFDLAVEEYRIMIEEERDDLMARYESLLSQSIIEYEKSFGALSEVQSNSIKIASYAKTIELEFDKEQYSKKPLSRSILSGKSSTQSVCTPFIEERVLIKGMLFDQLTIKSADDCKSAIMASRINAWYAWIEESNLTPEQNIFDELVAAKTIEPKSSLNTFTKETTDINVVAETKYSLYKNAPDRLVDVPTLYNTGRGISLVANVIFSVKPSVKKIKEKLSDTIEKIDEIHKKYGSALFVLEASLDVFTILGQTELSTVIPDTHQYLFKTSQDLSKAVSIIDSTLGTISSLGSEVEPQNIPSITDIFSKLNCIKYKEGSKSCTKANSITFSKTIIKLIFYKGILDRLNPDGFKISNTCIVPNITIARRLAKHGLNTMNNKDKVEFINSNNGYKCVDGDFKISFNKYIAESFKSKNAQDSFKEFLGDFKTSQLKQVILSKLKGLGSSSLISPKDINYAVGNIILSEFTHLGDNLVPILISNLGPQKYAKLIIAGGELGGFAFDLATKPSYIEVNATPCDDGNASVCLSASLPPLDVVPHIVVVDEDNDSNNIYLLDSTTKILSIAGRDEARDETWQDGNKFIGSEARYVSGLPLNNSSNFDSIMVLSGAQLSYELDAFISPRNFFDMNNFITSAQDGDTFNFNWFVYQHKKNEWGGSKGYQLPVKSKATSFNNNFEPLAIDTDEYDCELEETHWYSGDCRDVYIRVKDQTVTNPVLQEYINEFVTLNARLSDSVDVDELVLISFTKAVREKGWYEYANFKTPGVFSVSTDMKIGGATWESGVNIFVIPDYLKSEGDNVSHQTAFIGQSRLQKDTNDDLIGINFKLVRADSYNYFSFNQSNYSINHELFYPVLKAETEMGDTIFVELNPVYLNSEQGDTVSLNGITDNLTPIELYVYDSVMAAFIEQKGSSFVQWIEKDSKVTKASVQVGKNCALNNCTWGGQPYIKVDWNDLQEEVINVQQIDFTDSDNDGYPDYIDKFPNDIRYAFDSDNDGMADQWETDNNLEPFSLLDVEMGPNGDPDGDYLNNLTEFERTLELSNEFIGYDPHKASAKWKSSISSLNIVLTKDTPQNLYILDEIENLLGLSIIDVTILSNANANANANDDGLLPTTSFNSDINQWQILANDEWELGVQSPFELIVHLSSGERVSHIIKTTSNDVENVTVNEFIPLNILFESNNAPIANAGDDQTVTESTIVTLNASQSSDVEDDATQTTLTYRWAQIDSSEYNVTLSDSSIANPTFNAPDVTEETMLTFELTVTDSQSATANDIVDIYVDPTSANTFIYRGVEYGTVVSPITSKIWLDRNLGALKICTSPTDIDCYGDYFQWGRKSNGHEKANSVIDYQLVENDTAQNDKFIGVTSEPWDWKLNRDDNLWSGSDALNNPCPVGFRVPTISELTNEVKNSYVFEESFLKLPFAGGRGTNVVFDQGVRFRLWSSNSGGEYEGGLNGLALSLYGGTTTSAKVYRATGQSVRCIESENTSPVEEESETLNLISLDNLTGHVVVTRSTSNDGLNEVIASVFYQDKAYQQAIIEEKDPETQEITKSSAFLNTLFGWEVVGNSIQFTHSSFDTYSVNYSDGEINLNEVNSLGTVKELYKTSRLTTTDLAGYRFTLLGSRQNTYFDFQADGVLYLTENGVKSEFLWEYDSDQRLFIGTQSSANFIGTFDAFESGMTFMGGFLIDITAIPTNDKSSFNMIWRVEAGQTIQIPIRHELTYNYQIDWGDGSPITSETTIAQHTYKNSGDYTVKIAGTYPSIYFYGSDCLSLIDISQWGKVKWQQTMDLAFHGCSNFKISASDVPDLTNLTSLSRMFAYATKFNGDISKWDVSNITDMRGMFLHAREFNSDISKWDVSNVTDMGNMFEVTKAFKSDISEWDVSHVTHMDWMFAQSEFDGDISKWNVGSVINMQNMFAQSKFNGDISKWDVSSTTNMVGMFSFNNSFQSDISNWNVSNVLRMDLMFQNNTVFNGNISNWDVSQVTVMHHMFNNSIAFSKDLSSWNVSKVYSHENFSVGSNIIAEPIWP